jgi:effector-binding domain-containing protein
MKTIIFLTVVTMSALIFTSCGEEKKEEKKEEVKEEAKEEVEEPTYNYTYDVTEEDVQGGWMVSITTENITTDKVGQILGDNYGVITTFLTKAKKEMGIPFSTTNNWVDEKTPFTLVAGIPVMDSTIKVKTPMTLGKSYKGKAVKVQYFGDYSKIQPAYNDIMQYISEKSLIVNGSPWEVYITDPMVEKDTLKWQTDVYMPVK